MSCFTKLGLLANSTKVIQPNKACRDLYGVPNPSHKGYSVYCTYCGVQNTDDANFCFSCGKAIGPRPSEAIEQKTEESELQETQEEPELQETQEETSNNKSEGNVSFIIFMIVLFIIVVAVVRCVTN